MVEREVAVDKERPLVAAVIYNRLKQGDAARDRRDDPLRDRQLRRAADRIANWRSTRPTTRAPTPGLPPGPIANPGLASIEAAARPAKVDYLFYVVKPGTCGEHAFSTTEAEFEADVAALQRGRATRPAATRRTC